MGEGGSMIRQGNAVMLIRYPCATVVTYHQGIAAVYILYISVHTCM